MALPTTRVELGQYSLRKLGAPVLEINIDEDQIEDRLDEALNYMQTFHGDAIQKSYYKHQVTSADITNQYIVLPDSITVVNRVLPIGSGSGSSSNWMNADWQITKDLFHGLNTFTFSIAEYEMTRQHLSLIQHRTGSGAAARFSRHDHKLYVQANWGTEVKEGDYIVVDSASIVDISTTSVLYSDAWLLKYTTALMKQQWGANLIKFEGMQLPGGVTMNGSLIFEQATTEIAELEEKIRLDYEEPVDFFVG